jgi:hypothetical protein
MAEWASFTRCWQQRRSSFVVALLCAQKAMILIRITFVQKIMACNVTDFGLEYLVIRK